MGADSRWDEFEKEIRTTHDDCWVLFISSSNEYTHFL